MDFKLDELKSAMIVQTKKNDIVANNISNANTIGFKKDKTYFDSFMKGEISNLSFHTEQDLSQGELKSTDNPLDFAISGRGYFTINNNGRELYTREGHFSTDKNGYIVTGNGDEIMGEGGPINIMVDGDGVQKIHVNNDGEIFADDIYVDRLIISDFSEDIKLKRFSGNTFAPENNSDLPSRLEQPNIIQGKLEGSNVNPVSEMVNLLELQRSFESSQRTIKIIDRVLSQASTQLSKV